MSEPERVAGLPPFLSAARIDKRFGVVHALRDVSISLSPGEVVAIVGENGAGKSTLMKILGGVHSADSGEITIDGMVTSIGSVTRAHDLGIALIHQELNLADNLDIGANLFLGREPHRRGFIDHARIARESRELLDRVGLDVPTHRLVSTLSIGQRQLVEIAKALAVEARLLIMDEPTSSLTLPESERLFEVIDRLRDDGVCILYISHRLGEVKRLADRVVVLRDGARVGHFEGDEIEHGAMVQRMVGRDLDQFYVHEPLPAGDVVLHVDRLRTLAHPDRELSFEVRRGEIVGIAGLVGAGRTELLEALFGATPPISGSATLLGKRLDLTTPKSPIAEGIALVPEDRKATGLILPFSVRHNLSLASIHRRARRGFLDRRYEAELATRSITELSIRTSSADVVVDTLSGGNQQKVVLGRWLALAPKLLLLDEPTRGVDIGAKQEIYRLMERLVATGIAILFVSSEMEEILGMSDRALVMHEGSIQGELGRRNLSEEAVMHLATGGV